MIITSIKNHQTLQNLEDTTGNDPLGRESLAPLR